MCCQPCLPNFQCIQDFSVFFHCFQDFSEENFQCFQDFSEEEEELLAEYDDVIRGPLFSLASGPPNLKPTTAYTCLVHGTNFPQYSRRVFLWCDNVHL